MNEKYIILAIKCNKILNIDTTLNENHNETSISEKLNFYNLFKLINLKSFIKVVVSYVKRSFLMLAASRETIIEETKVLEYIKNKITVENVAIFYTLATIFNLKTISNCTFSLIARRFATVVENRNFLELDYSCAAKILASSELSKTAELEAFHAAERWLTFKLEQRNKFAEPLLRKIRLHELSDGAMKRLSSEPSLFYKAEGIEIFKEVARGNWPVHSYKGFEHNILLIGGHDCKSTANVRDVRQVNGDGMSVAKKPVPDLIEAGYYARAVCRGSDVYLFGSGRHVEKYSPLIGRWEQAARQYDERSGFCACLSLSGEIHLLGGHHETRVGAVATASCLRFDTERSSWAKVSKMKRERSNAACALFNDVIVVCGGSVNFRTGSNQAERYDASDESWSAMADTVGCHKDHGLVVVRKKLFVVDMTFEVYDGDKFVLLKTSFPSFYSPCFEAVAVGDAFVAFQNWRPYVTRYDVIKDEWEEICFEATRWLGLFDCVKVPWILEDERKTLSE